MKKPTRRSQSTGTMRSSVLSSSPQTMAAAVSRATTKASSGGKRLAALRKERCDVGTADSMPRRSGRASAEQPSRLRFAQAPSLWRRIVHDNVSVRRAITVLTMADEEEVAEAIQSPLGILTPVIRAAGVCRREGDALEFIRLALERGFSPDTSSPLLVSDFRTPPIVAAATEALNEVVRTLLDAGASPAAVDSDSDNVFHASLKHDVTVQLLLDHPRMADVRASLASSPNKYGRTPLVAALCHERFSKSIQQSALKLAPFVTLTDHDFRILDGKYLKGVKGIKRLKSLAALESGLRRDPNHWHPKIHWSFPTSDRATLRHIFELSKRAHGARLPPDLWLLVFSFVQRGWFVPPLVAPDRAALHGSASAVIARERASGGGSSSGEGVLLRDMASRVAAAPFAMGLQAALGP